MCINVDYSSRGERINLRNRFELRRQKRLSFLLSRVKSFESSSVIGDRDRDDDPRTGRVSQNRPFIRAVRGTRLIQLPL